MADEIRSENCKRAYLAEQRKTADMLAERRGANIG